MIGRNNKQDVKQISNESCCGSLLGFCRCFVEKKIEKIQTELERSSCLWLWERTTQKCIFVTWSWLLHVLWKKYTCYSVLRAMSAFCLPMRNIKSKWSSTVSHLFHNVLTIPLVCRSTARETQKGSRYCTTTSTVCHRKCRFIFSI